MEDCDLSRWRRRVTQMMGEMKREGAEMRDGKEAGSPLSSHMLIALIKKKKKSKNNKGILEAKDASASPKT